MWAENVRGRGISGAIRYVLGEGRDKETNKLIRLAPGEKSRVAWIGGTGFGFSIKDKDDAELARKIMEFTAANQNGKVTNVCHHLILSWRDDIKPSREEMEAAAHSALKALGMENAQAIFSAHQETKCSHLHIVASKINPDTGKAFSDSFENNRLMDWAHKYELTHGGIQCEARAAKRQGREELEAAAAWKAARDPEKVLENITRTRSTFSRADLMRHLRQTIPDEKERAEIAAAVLARPEIVGLKEAEGAAVTRYTTAAILETEKRALEHAAALSRNTRHGVNDRIKSDVLDRFNLGTDQRAAFDRATAAEGLAIIDGKAGTGKSYTLKAVREAYEQAGFRVVGLSWTNGVVEDMRADGFRNANTVKSELFGLGNPNSRTVGRKWDRRTVVIVDEAAMLDTEHFSRLTAEARAAGAKLIPVGDEKQFSSIQRGGLFGALKQEHGAATLSIVRRQNDEANAAASAQLADGAFMPALQHYQKQGAINWTGTQDEARAALVKKWADDMAADPSRRRFVFAFRNIDVTALNADLRAIQRERGALGEDHLLQTKEGKAAFATGDRVQITETRKSEGLYNGYVGTITAIEEGRITLKIDGKNGHEKEIIFDTAEFNGFRHGYAGTIYKGQGRTLDDTYLLHSHHWRSNAAYVALTRHSDNVSLFVAKDTARDLRQLARQMARQDDTRAASQLIPDRDTGPAAPISLGRLRATLATKQQPQEAQPMEAAADQQQPPHEQRGQSQPAAQPEGAAQLPADEARRIIAADARSRRAERTARLAELTQETKEGQTMETQQKQDQTTPSLARLPAEERAAFFAQGRQIVEQSDRSPDEKARMLEKIAQAELATRVAAGEVKPPADRPAPIRDEPTAPAFVIRDPEKAPSGAAPDLFGRTTPTPPPWPKAQEAAQPEGRDTKTADLFAGKPGQEQPAAPVVQEPNRDDDSPPHPPSSGAQMPPTPQPRQLTEAVADQQPQPRKQHGQNQPAAAPMVEPIRPTVTPPDPHIPAQKAQEPRRGLWEKAKGWLTRKRPDAAQQPAQGQDDDKRPKTADYGHTIKPELVKRIEGTVLETVTAEAGFKPEAAPPPAAPTRPGAAPRAAQPAAPGLGAGTAAPPVKAPQPPAQGQQKTPAQDAATKADQKGREDDQKAMNIKQQEQAAAAGLSPTSAASSEANAERKSDPFGIPAGMKKEIDKAKAELKEKDSLTPSGPSPRGRGMGR